MKRTALVTGGTRGIGLGVARVLAREGFDLTLGGVRRPDQVKEALQDLRDFGGQVHYIPADISTKDGRQRLITETRKLSSRLNVLVNNAGVAPKERKDLLDADEDSFEWVLAVNLVGPYFLTQAAARWMIETREEDPDFESQIINISSVSASMASTNRGEYCVSKAGLAMASQLWSLRLSEHEIPVYEIRPGIIETDMTAGVREKYDCLIQEGLVPQKRWGKPQDIGLVVRALVRGDLGYSTGTVIYVDGGLSISRL